MLTNPQPAQLDQLFESVSGYFALLSEPTRIKILYTLCTGERAVNDIVEQVGSTQANVSRHLKMLHGAKVLTRRKEGTQVYYSIEDTHTMDLCRMVCTQMSARIEKQTTFNKDVVKKFIRANA